MSNVTITCLNSCSFLATDQCALCRSAKPFTAGVQQCCTSQIFTFKWAPSFYCTQCVSHWSLWISPPIIHCQKLDALGYIFAAVSMVITLTIGQPLCRSESFNVTTFGTSRKPVCDFICLTIATYIYILHCFQIMSDCWSNFHCRQGYLALMQSFRVTP